MLGMGVFHTGIELYDTEFAYGGHPYEFSGIFEITPKDAEDLGDHYKYKETIVLGYTSFTKEEVQQAVTHLGRDFKGTNYHLMNKNCNHFSGELCQLLCGQELPNWVNRLAYVSTCIPFLEKCIPKDWLTPCALDESVKLATSASGGNNPGQGSSNPSSSRNSLVGGAGATSSGGGMTFWEMIRSGNGNGNNATGSASGSTSPPPCSSGGGIVASFLNSCNGGTRKSSTSSESSLPPPITQSSQSLTRTDSLTSTDSKTGLLQRSSKSSF
ncbi:deubiquitinase DESI2 isoform X2 [Folsomia candida]|nr:deubiquitinase DESI2 isoform X2 [Folsomia candida]XP_035706990.1 deubiquitinase DESI2 isoform X2 [Folsomia candida]